MSQICGFASTPPSPNRRFTRARCMRMHRDILCTFVCNTSLQHSISATPNYDLINKWTNVSIAISSDPIPLQHSTSATPNYDLINTWTNAPIAISSEPLNYGWRERRWMTPHQLGEMNSQPSSLLHVLPGKFHQNVPSPLRLR